MFNKIIEIAKVKCTMRSALYALPYVIHKNPFKNPILHNNMFRKSNLLRFIRYGVI